MSIPIRDLMNTAIDAAYAGGRRAMAHYNNRVEVEIKDDGTPVTRADRESEEVILNIIRSRYPQSAIVAEESGRSGTEGASLRWIIDPIDGTKTFIAGAPMWGVMIGVEQAGKTVAGVVYFPALDDMVAAGNGLGCHWNGRIARVSDVADFSQAMVLTTDWQRATRRSKAFESIASQARVARTWGDCYGHILVATGRADVMLDPILNPWDCGPLLPIMQEAGGHFTTWKGEPTVWGPDGISVNAKLFQPTLDAIRAIEGAK
ncbi:MAG TPA: inositol monophosphatase family protein [Tepidisphaeraceae bacterium]|jgi:histidinol phosphatase-like enzyme (inositol monophosphatase family)|nr:inositol monophosphatase family protein [Tepidisphaeraceae bacterium]